MPVTIIADRLKGAERASGPSTQLPKREGKPWVS